MKTLIRITRHKEYEGKEGYVDGYFENRHDINAVVVMNGQLHIFRVDQLKVIQPKEIIEAVREVVVKVAKEVLRDGSESNIAAISNELVQDVSKIYSDMAVGVMNGYSIGYQLRILEAVVRMQLSEIG